MRIVPWSLGALVGLVSCGEPRPPVEPAPASVGFASDAAAALEPSAREPAPVVPVVPSASLDASPGAPATPDPPALAACGRVRWVPGYCHTPRGGALVSGDWLTAHGARAGDVKSHADLLLLGGACEALAVGPTREEALACSYATKSATAQAYRRVDRLRLVAVRGGRVVVLLDVPYSMASFDDGAPPPVPGSAPRRPREVALFALALDTREPSSAITLAEPRPGACAEVRKARAEEVAASRRAADPAHVSELLRLDEKLVGSLCAAVGRYVYAASSGTYRLAPP